MSQLSRQIAILTSLRAKRIITGPEIAAKYDVSLRTVYRDIRALEKAGIPIVTIEGKGYELLEGYTVPPVMFTEKEANALVTAEQLVRQSQDQSFKTNFEGALLKIKSVFRNGLQEKSEFLDSRMLIYQPFYEDFSSDSLAEIQAAIVNFQLLKMSYRKAGATEVTERTVEPCAIYGTNDKWILIAWCRLRKSYRSFRIDRIAHFELLVDNFEDRQFVLQSYFVGAYDD